MKKKVLSILAFLLLTVSGAWTQDVIGHDWDPVQTSSSAWTPITEGSTTGFELKDAYYYVTENLTFTNTINGEGKGCGMSVQSGRTVTLYIPAGVTLTAIGADAEGTTGAGAGILVPAGTTLNIVGSGTLVAKGGKAANGENGGNGSKGQLETKDESWYWGAKIVCGVGGNGGYGGGGAGAGIGTAGGNGGVGGYMTEGPAESYEEWEGGDLAGITGKDGSAGTSADEMGTLYIQSTITQNIQGGAAGNGGAAGWPGNVSTTGGEIEFEGVEFVNGIPIPTFDDSDIQAVAGGGGGGGGAGGGSAKAIGTGGAGGGGGASGAHGSACAHNGWLNDYWGSVGAGGGQGGVGTDANNGEAGYTCWFEGDHNIFDDEENHKPGGIGGDSGSESTSTTPGSATSPQYSVSYYTEGVTPSQSSENYNVSSSTTITLPSPSSGSNYKWILSIYGNEAGKNTTSHCAGPNGDVYAPGDEVDLSNIYGDIEFTAIYAVTLTDGGDLSGLATYIGQTIAVAYARAFTADKPSTVCLPFAYEKKAGETFYTFTGITKETSGFVATMTEYAGATLSANTPYLYKAATTGDTDFSGVYTIPATIAPETSTSGDWKFTGTYSDLTYGTAPFSGYVYGFAAQASGDVEAGQFVMAAAGATIAPMRCYLTYNDGAEYKASARTRDALAADELPQTITVRFIGSNGETTGIGTLNTRTGELSADGWYTLDGRRLSEKPAKKGLYINDGRKVVIK